MSSEEVGAQLTNVDGEGGGMRGKGEMAKDAGKKDADGQGKTGRTSLRRRKERRD